MGRPAQQPRRPRAWVRRAGAAVCALAVGAGVLAGSAGAAAAQVAVPAPPSASPAPAPAGPAAPRMQPAAPGPGASPPAPAPSGGDAPTPSTAPSPRPSEEGPAPGTGAGEVPPPPSAELTPAAPQDAAQDPAAGQPTPTPNPQPGAPPDPNAGGGGWVSNLFGFGWLDIPGRILRAINGWFAGLVEAALEPVVRLLGQTVLSTPEVTEQPRVRELWVGSVLIANAVMLLVLMAGGVAAMGYDSVQTRATAKEMLPRMILGFGAANLSLVVMGWAITGANALSRAFTDMGDLDGSGAMSVLLTVLAAGALSNIFLIILGIGVVGLMVMLIVGWIIRVAVLMGLAVAGPLMLICHGLPWTEGVANLYWRALGGCLAVQVGQSVLLTLGIRILLATDDGGYNPIPVADTLANLLTAAALFFITVKLQSFASQHLMGGGRSTVVSLVKYRLLRAGLHRLGIPL